MNLSNILSNVTIEYKNSLVNIFFSSKDIKHNLLIDYINLFGYAESIEKEIKIISFINANCDQIELISKFIENDTFGFSERAEYGKIGAIGGSYDLYTVLYYDVNKKMFFLSSHDTSTDSLMIDYFLLIDLLKAKLRIIGFFNDL